MKFLDKFYLNIGLKSLIVFSVVYSFMFFSFIWGNHDWEYLTNQINFYDNFFEARFTVHLFNFLFTEGYVLPIIGFVWALIGLVGLGIVILSYFGVPKNKCSNIMILLLLGLFPYNFVVFYYLFLVVPFYWWAALGVGFLFLAEAPFKKWKVVAGGLGYLLLLGSYPPNIALVLCVFVGKKIFDYVFRNKEFREIFYSSLMFGLQLLVGAILFKILLIMVGFDSEKMYNVRTLAIGDILINIPKELVYSVVNLFKLKGELGYWGVAFLVGVIGGGCFGVIKRAKNKFVVVGMILVLLVCSRFMFLVSREAQIAFFRGGYWGILGLVVWGMSVFCFEKNNLVKNLFFVFSVVFLLVFIIRDFEIQKTRKLLFDAEIKLKERVKTRVISNKAFSYDNDYVSLIFGSYDFWEHFCVDGCKGYSSEILASVSMSGDFVPLLFFEDEKYPVTVKLGAWERLIWHIKDGKFVKYRGSFQGINREDVNNIKSFMYYNEKEWPSNESVFIDGKHIFIMFKDGRENVYLLTPQLLDFLSN